MRLFPTRLTNSTIQKLLDYYSQYNPTPMSIKQFIDFGKLLKLLNFNTKKFRNMRCSAVTAIAAQLISDVRCNIYLLTIFFDIRNMNIILVWSRLNALTQKEIDLKLIIKFNVFVWVDHTSFPVERRLLLFYDN